MVTAENFETRKAAAMAKAHEAKQRIASGERWIFEAAANPDLEYAARIVRRQIAGKATAIGFIVGAIFGSML